MAAVVSPDMHYDTEDAEGRKNLKALKKILKEHGIKEGLKIAEEEEIPISPKPVSSFTMTFDSQQAQLEPIYYWLLDFIQDGGWKTEKITDNFMASPGSGQFQEMGLRATRLQEEGLKILGGMNQIVKSVLNLIYDLKEFEMRLAHYDDAASEDKKTKENGLLALKQVWLDNVDLKRGRGAIHQMAAELGFTTIREVFMMANSTDDLEKMNSEDEKEGGSGLINDQVKRILIPRIDEFLKWIKYSERELRKRFKIETSYLKSQVETIKLYSQWMKPYLKSAQALQQKGFEKSAALVNAFSTSMFELTIMGTQPAKVPSNFNYKLKRGYNSVIVIGFTYRGHVSQRVTQKGDYGYAMGGRVDMTFDAYALNDEELVLLKKKLDEEDVGDTLQFSGDIAAEALDDLKEDLDYFLKSDEEKEEIDKKEKKKKKTSEDINPFSALFSMFTGSGKKKKKKDKKEIADFEDIAPDNFVEKTVRANAAESAADGLYLVYDIYKKAHGMASSPENFENMNPAAAKEPDVKFKDIFKSKFEKIK